MHLLHLSANARGSQPQQSTSPESAAYYPPPSTTPHLQQQTPTNLRHSGYSDTIAGQSVLPSPVQVGNQAVKEEVQLQLPTPETLMESSQADGFQPYYSNTMMNGMIDMTKIPFSDFLREVMFDQAIADNLRMGEVQGLDVLDFCDDANLEMNDMDFGVLNAWNIDGVQPNAGMPELLGPEDGMDVTKMRSDLVKIWTESPWRWSPTKTDNGFEEQTNLPLTSRDITGSQMQEGSRRLDRVITDSLHPSGRDKILAIVLNTCRNDGTMNRVASSFPSAELMDSWIHIFLASHLCQVSSFIHYGSFSLNSQWPEWLAIAASAGAALANVPTLRRFGFALQEAVRKFDPCLESQPWPG
jgi:hypothetical protein